MLTLNSASKDGLVFIVLWLLAQTLASVSSIEIIRSGNDKVLFGKDYHKMVNLTDNRTMNCDGGQSCQCNRRDGYNTVIYNKTTNFIKCVKDENEAMDMNADDWHNLTTNNGKCLGVSKQIIYKTSCTNNLSLRWIWFGFLNILNLKTLKCLEWNYNSKEFTTAQCKIDKEEQQWSRRDGKIILNGKNSDTIKPLRSSLFTNGIVGYKGCYRVSGDKMIGVIKRSPNCEERPQRKCKIAVNVNAPITYQEDSTCKILWERSTYSSLGETWNPINSTDQELFELNRINQETITLNANNTDTFFERWGGTLIKLHIKCGNEQHCTILKIATMEYSKIPSTVKTSTVKQTLSVEGRSKMSSMLFIIPVVVILCLLIVALVIVVYYRRRRKRSSSKEDIHLYEETTGGDIMTNYEEPGELIKTQPPTANSYESPGKTIHVGSLYEDPTYSISQQDSVKIPPKNNNFQYDYATREEDSILPLILNGDVIFEDGKPGSQSLREKRDCHAGQPHPQPFYHTLDEDISGTDKNSLEQPKSCDKHDSHAGLPHEKAIYHTLEEDTSLTDNDASKPSNAHDKKPLDHILEKDTSDSGKEVNTKRKNSREQPFYNTLENDYEEI